MDPFCASPVETLLDGGYIASVSLLPISAVASGFRDLWPFECDVSERAAALFSDPRHRCVVVADFIGTLMWPTIRQGALAEVWCDEHPAGRLHSSPLCRTRGQSCSPSQTQANCE